MTGGVRPREVRTRLRGELDQIPTQVRKLRGPQAVPIGYENIGRPLPTPTLTCALCGGAYAIERGSGPKPSGGWGPQKKGPTPGGSALNSDEATRTRGEKKKTPGDRSRREHIPSVVAVAICRKPQANNLPLD